MIPLRDSHGRRKRRDHLLYIKVETCGRCLSRFRSQCGVGKSEGTVVERVAACFPVQKPAEPVE